MSKCINCNEVELTNPKAKFCSDKCKKRYNRDKYKAENNRDTQSGQPRRGKDITKFEHLPPDVQQTIDRISESDEEHARRTAIAINYQHVFPDKYIPDESAGDVVITDHDFSQLMVQGEPGVKLRVSRPGDTDYKPLCETTRKWARGEL